MLKRFGFSLTHGWNWRSVRCVAGFQHTIEFYTNGAVAQTVFNPLDNACHLTMGFLLENASKIHHPVWLAYGSLSNRFYGPRWVIKFLINIQLVGYWHETVD